MTFQKFEFSNPIGKILSPQVKCKILRSDRILWEKSIEKNYRTDELWPERSDDDNIGVKFGRTNYNARKSHTMSYLRNQDMVEYVVIGAADDNLS